MTNTCTVIGGCTAPGHRACGCHQYGWTLCPIGQTYKRAVEDAEGRHGFRSRQRRRAVAALRVHNPVD